MYNPYSQTGTRPGTDFSFPASPARETGSGPISRPVGAAGPVSNATSGPAAESSGSNSGSAGVSGQQVSSNMSSGMSSAQDQVSGTQTPTGPPAAVPAPGPNSASHSGPGGYYYGGNPQYAQYLQMQSQQMAQQPGQGMMQGIPQNFPPQGVQGGAASTDGEYAGHSYGYGYQYPQDRSSNGQHPQNQTAPMQGQQPPRPPSQQGPPAPSFYGYRAPQQYDNAMMMMAGFGGFGGQGLGFGGYQNTPSGGPAGPGQHQPPHQQSQLSQQDLARAGFQGSIPNNLGPPGSIAGQAGVPSNQGNQILGGLPGNAQMMPTNLGMTGGYSGTAHANPAVRSATRIQQPGHRPTTSQQVSAIPTSVTVTDPTGQRAPPGIKPKVTTTLWEDEGTMCFQVEARGFCVARREDNNMINGTKLLNVAGMTRGRRDGLLKGERQRHVVKAGAMHLKGVWIPYERALDFANKERILDMLYPLFVADIKSVLYHPASVDSVRPSVPTGQMQGIAQGQLSQSQMAQGQLTGQMHSQTQGQLQGQLGQGQLGQAHPAQSQIQQSQQPTNQSPADGDKDKKEAYSFPGYYYPK